jgi:MEMO1 family protein
MMSKPDVRPSPISGKWYPADPAHLAVQVDGYIRAARLPQLSGEIVAVMVPHAGYRYSGPVAGYAFAALKDQSVEVVAVVSPMHYPYEESLLTTAHAAYATPLGTVPVDMDLLQALDERLDAGLGFRLARVAHDPEHSLEIELPFLQRALQADFRLLPVMVRDQSAYVAECLGKALAKVLVGRRALLVASTDLSHFFPQAVAKVLDGEILRQVEAFDPQGVLRAEQEGKGFACGHGALAAVLWAAKELGADCVQVLRHATSGDVTGDYDQVVGYAAAIATRQIKVG